MNYLKVSSQIENLVYSRINKRVEQNVGDQKQDINGILPSDK